MFGVHSDVGEVARGLGIEEPAQGVFDVVAVKPGFDLEEEARLHAHAAEGEPLAFEIGHGVAVLVGEVEVVLVVIEDPLRLRPSGDRLRG